MEEIRCPNPKCRRRILDDEGTETEWTVLEIKCQHCGKLVRLHFGPEGIEAGIWSILCASCYYERLGRE